MKFLRRLLGVDATSNCKRSVSFYILETAVNGDEMSLLERQAKDAQQRQLEGLSRVRIARTEFRWGRFWLTWSWDIYATDEVFPDFAELIENRERTGGE